LVSKGYNSRDETAFTSVKKWQDTLLDINPEGDLLREIKDILDELFIMTLIKTQQDTVIRTFVKNVHRLQNWANLGDVDNRNDRSSPGLFKPKQRRASSLTTVPYLTPPDQHYNPEDINWTQRCARELEDNLQDQLIELQFLKNAAENTSFAFSTNYTLVPISAFIITCSLLLAFSKLVRAFLSFWFSIAWTWLITSTPAYIRWRETHLNSKKLAEEETKIVNRMKKKALQREFQRAEEERVRREEMLKEGWIGAVVIF
jgi:hypothetical protein